jgi:two-component system, NarL family, sensor histidine kinase UhpB
MERVKEAVLNLSLFYKALIANSIIIFIGGGVSILAARNLIEPATMEEATVYIAAAAGISILANYLVLRVAFIPLQELRETVDDYLLGNVQVRAQKSLLGAPQVNDLADILNIILDQLQEYTSAIEKKNAQLQRLSAQVMTAQEEERKRLSRELHDETGQMLTSLVVGFKMLESAKDLDEVKERVAELKELTSQTLEEVRKMAYALRPAALDDLGLVPALRGYIKEIELTSTFKVSLETTGLKDRLPPQMETVLYRTIQEALTNIVRHSDAQLADITIRQTKAYVTATISDDGGGFDVEKALRNTGHESGLGLFGMNERATLVGGHLKIASQPGQGTRITVTIPLNGELEHIEQDHASAG